MRIITRGAIKARVFIGKCRHCDTVAEWNLNELRDEYDEQEHKGWKSAECPLCRERVHALRETTI